MSDIFGFRRRRRLNEIATEYWTQRGEELMKACDEAAAAHKAGHTAAADTTPPSASLRQVGGTHYKDMTVQPWDVVDDWPPEQRIGFYRGGALKYLMRAGSKGERTQDVEKARHYLEKLVEVLRAAEGAPR